MGPYHPALPQPVALSFKLRGETVANVAPPGVGYCRRGIETLASGTPVSQALEIVERSCSFAGHSHRVALCQAIEAATGAAPSQRAQLVRAVFAEVERILARLWTIGMTARAAGLHALFRDALAQREQLCDALTTTTGQRLFWGIAEPGGVRALEDAADLAALATAIDQLTPAVQTWRIGVGPRGPLGRIGAGVGRITEERAQALHLAGLAAHAAGVKGDLRRDAPYGAYQQISFDWTEDAVDLPAGGDVTARMVRAVSDIATSLRLARALLDALPTADDTAVVADGKRTASRDGRGAVEGPHGAVEVNVALARAGAVERLTLGLAAASLVAALPELLEGQRLDLVPMILASLDLCMECGDL
jgi:Ni,Fe-hydrogenase III large subunit